MAIIVLMNLGMGAGVNVVLHLFVDLRHLWWELFDISGFLINPKHLCGAIFSLTSCFLGWASNFFGPLAGGSGESFGAKNWFPSSSKVGVRTVFGVFYPIWSHQLAFQVGVDQFQMEFSFMNFSGWHWPIWGWGSRFPATLQMPTITSRTRWCHCWGRWLWYVNCPPPTI